MSASTSVIGDQYTPISAAEVSAYRSAGHWQGKTLRSLLSEAAAAVPDRTAVRGYSKGAEPMHRTYAQLETETHRLAVGLAGLGVGPGDVVAVMMANRVEYTATAFAINEVGAIYTGIPVAYGELQARAILEQSGAKVLVVQANWGSTDLLDQSRRLRQHLPALDTIVVVDAAGIELTANEVPWPDLAREADGELPELHAGDVCYLGFTSGTTGAPKGAMHSHETLHYTAVAMADHLGARLFGDPMIQLVASPMGHHTGYAWGIMFTALLRGTAVLVDRWDPQWATEVIRTESVTAFFGAPTFTQDLLRTDLAGDQRCPLSCIVIAGSTVPRTLPGRAATAFGAYVAPAWGMTECGILTSCTPSEDDAILHTDGAPFEASAVRVVDEDLHDLPPGEVGDLLMRGPGVSLGYFNRAEATKDAFAEGLWFNTGDTATLDENGWVTIRGRTRDIIIRGGENIPVTDVETLLFDHPDVIDAALVAYPDDRLGERACAVVTLRENATLALPELCAYLTESGLSRHFLPERLLVLDRMPTTQSGKIQKFVLRDLVVAQS
ncbi:AMP-binding protein [Nocardia miyunensis]|uniref:AMP-binding protein n=1 Tax=Nocardia miyunensis TaxID=282684 RepID=UPI000834F221|nr:AMP-binding protein [Nocardia miyunensis]